MILMVGVGIVGIGSYVPPKIMTNEDWENIVDTSNKWIVEKTGIIERRISEPDVCTSDSSSICCYKSNEVC